MDISDWKMTIRNRLKISRKIQEKDIAEINPINDDFVVSGQDDISDGNGEYGKPVVSYIEMMMTQDLSETKEQLLDYIKKLQSDLKDKQKDIELAASVGQELLVSNQKLKEELRSHLRKSNNTLPLAASSPTFDGSYVLNLEKANFDLLSKISNLESTVQQQSKLQRRIDAAEDELKRVHESYEKKCVEVDDLHQRLTKFAADRVQDLKHRRFSDVSSLKSESFGVKLTDSFAQVDMEESYKELVKKLEDKVIMLEKENKSLHEKLIKKEYVSTGTCTSNELTRNTEFSEFVINLCLIFAFAPVEVFKRLWSSLFT